ncbi:hypothetical protein BCR39DRAFT_548287 [Naematelia encephala]|uniref:Uncharacterized protein n=1 Tax=Naematelia encephala TaxID=71784 RepID=A0A1Y2ANQ7_9TREE|nr:hypothetical protein BCR39DRAFT_548287 [Naematelia encephala]
MASEVVPHRGFEPGTSDLPKKNNRSFIDRLLGLGLAGSDDDDDDEASGDSDEVMGSAEQLLEVTDESLREEAQAALIAHLPSLATEKLSVAALPPYRSPEACLSLGNILTRGSSLHPIQRPPDRDFPAPLSPRRRSSTSPQRNTHSSTSAKGSMDSYSSIVSTPSTIAKNRILSLFFRPSPPSTPPVESPPLVSPTRQDVASNGWIMRKEGKRVVRDVKGMGMAAGWYTLGVGWVVDAELAREQHLADAQAATDFTQSEEGVYERERVETADDGLIMAVKGKGREKAVSTPQDVPSSSNSTNVNSTLSSKRPSTTLLSTESKSNQTESSEMIKTPFDPHAGREHWRTKPDEDDEARRLELLSDLLSPYLNLLRNGHIQSHDPVYLPPILPRQLPHVLRPQGDLEKGRNAWHLGGVVAERLLNLQILQKDLKGKSTIKGARAEIERKRIAVGVMAHYVLGMTLPSPQSEVHFRAVVELGQCGLQPADNLVEQAAKRLDIMLRAPSQPPTPASSHVPGKEYPFPTMTGGTKPVGRMADTSRSVSSHSAVISPRKAPARSNQRRSDGNKGLSEGVRRNGSIISKMSRSSRRSGSIVSINSIRSTGILPKRFTSQLSLASLNTSYEEPVQADLSLPETETAVDTLKAIRKHDKDALEAERERTLSSRFEEPVWPTLRGWTMRSGKRDARDIFAEGEQDPSLGVSPANTIRANPRTNGRWNGNNEASSSLTIRGLASSVRTMRPIASSPNLWSISPLSPATEARNNGTIKTFHLPGRPLHSPPSPSTSSLIASPVTPPPPATLSPPPAVILPRPRSTSNMPDPQIAPIDPVLAAVEMASPLTKRTECKVCGTKGVNFPACRRCGMTLCGRACRIGLDAAGNGKRHVCGLWESRQQAQAPQVVASVSARA